MNTAKHALTFFLSAMLTLSAWAVPAYRGWRTMTQPDGSTITIRQMGDEFFHYWENESGEQVEEDDQGFWRVLEKPAVPNELQKKIRASRRYNKKGNEPAKVGSINLAPRGLVILVNFTDVTFKTINTQAAMHDLMNSTNYTYNNATGSVREFFKTQSNGAYLPNFDVVGPYNLDYNRAHYGANSGEAGSDVLAANMVIEACKAADADGVDFTLYNNDGDSYVDFVYVIYAGVGEADANPKKADAIWPHNWTISSARYYGNCTYTASQCKVDGLTINNYACSGEMEGTNTYRCPIGTITHEFGHVLGLPDYYVTDENASNEGKDYTPGAWHIMDYGSYNNDGRTPPNYSPHDKYFFGWSTPTLLAKDEKKNCTLTTTYGSAYQITGGTALKAATAASRVWYLENRQKTGWDKYLPGHGMVVWEVTYNSNDWNNNEPNNENIGYTIVTANNLTRPYTPCVYNTTASSTSATPFPGTSNKKNWTPATGCALTEITESAGNITFKYNGGVDKTKCTYEFVSEHCTTPADGEVAINAPLSVTITPNSGYTLADASCWAVEMGGVELTYGTDFTYNASTNTFSISSLTDDVVIMAEAKVVRTVTWSVQGITSTTTFADGAALVLPSNPADCSGTGGKKFVGWTASSSVAGDKPADLFTAAGTKTVTANVTYYAVYATPAPSSAPKRAKKADPTEGTYKIYADISGTKYYAAGGTSGKLTNTTNAADAAIYTFETVEGGGIAIKSGDDYLGYGTSGTDFTTKNTQYAWVFSAGSHGTWRATSKSTTNRAIVYRTGSTNKFAPYAVSNINGTEYFDIELELVGGGSGSYTDYTTVCETCTLSSIELTTTGVKTTFVTNEIFTSEGLVVTANYSNCSSKAVIPNSVSTPDMSSAGGKTVTVSYTEGGETKTNTYQITVVAPKTVTYMACGDVFTTQDYAPGATLVLPTETPGANDGMTFYGWTATEHHTGSSAPAIISAGSAVNADVTYYAVFH